MTEYRTGVNGQVVIDPNEILGIEPDTDPNDEGVSVLLWPGRWRIRARSMGGGGSAGGSTGSTAWADITGKPSSFPPSAHQHPMEDVTDFTEATQDIVGAMVTGAGGTYDDAAGTITLPGGSSSTITADDTPAAPAEGESASYFVTSSVSWPAGLVWSTDPDGGVAPTITGTALVSLFTVGGTTRAIMGATFPGAVVPDTTAPVAGTLASSAITATGFTLTASGASDAGGLHATPYAFDPGAGTFGAWQESNSLAVTGKLAETAYTCRHKVRDAAGNEAIGASITVTTGAAPAGDTTAPAWSATLTTGTPAATSVVVAASALATDAVGVTGYERSIDGGSTWVDITPSGLNFTLSGLTAATSYPAPQLRAKDAAGNYSTPLTAQAFTTTAAPANLAAAILELSPAGYWKLDETTGTTAVDSSGNGRNGTYSSDHALNVGGFANFGGTGLVTIPDDDAFSVAGSSTGFTVFALVKQAASQPVPAPIASKMAPGSYEWSYFVDTSGAANISVYNADASAQLLNDTTTSTLATGVWHAVAVTIPAPTLGAEATHYFDSGTAQAGTHIQAAATLTNGPAPLTLAKRTDNSHTLIGQLGHVAIFRTQLSAAQVGTLVTAARAEGLIP